MTATKPTVGKIINYYREAPLPSGTPSDPGPDPEGQPLAALIAHVVYDPAENPYKVAGKDGKTTDGRTGGSTVNTENLKRYEDYKKTLNLKPEDLKRYEDYNETRVNLTVFRADGGTYNRENVLLLQDGVPALGAQFAEWPENTEARKKAEEKVRKEEADAAAKQIEADAKVKADEAAKAKARADALIALGGKPEARVNL